MASQILEATDDAVIFEVEAQTYKPGRFTMPAQVLRRLGLDWNGEVRLRIESLDAQNVLWAGTLRMQSGPEIDNAQLVQHFRPGERLRVVASRP